MKYWLIKSEESCYSIHDLKKDKKTSWVGVRNYQARNFLRFMKKGDLCLFYHSSCPAVGVYGLAEVVKEAYDDPTQFDPKDEHYDPKSKVEKPLWSTVDIKFVDVFKEPVSLTEIKADSQLRHLEVAQRGSRLSVHEVDKKSFEIIRNIGAK